jgi:hypothetical protein
LCSCNLNLRGRRRISKKGHTKGQAFWVFCVPAPARRRPHFHKRPHLLGRLLKPGGTGQVKRRFSVEGHSDKRATKGQTFCVLQKDRPFVFLQLEPARKTTHFQKGTHKGTGLLGFLCSRTRTPPTPLPQKATPFGPPFEAGRNRPSKTMVFRRRPQRQKDRPFAWDPGMDQSAQTTNNDKRTDLLRAWGGINLLKRRTTTKGQTFCVGSSCRRAGWSVQENDWLP